MHDVNYLSFYVSMVTDAYIVSMIDLFHSMILKLLCCISFPFPLFPFLHAIHCTLRKRF